MKQHKYYLALILLFVTNIYAQDVADLRKQFEQIQLKGAIITGLEIISDGTFHQPNSSAVYTNLPPFVRVKIVSKPSPDSNINTEVWLPIENWNGRFMGTGNGGGGGNIIYYQLASCLQRGFAVANTDLGTSPNVHRFVNMPEIWKDFGYRATHEMTVVSKAIIENYYKQAPRHSYFVGCSTGGQQALMEAQRFPEDYDGIIAGAPANNRTHLHTSFLWVHKVTNEEEGCQFTDDELQMVTDAILNENVGKDGGSSQDNFLTDPRIASFDFDSLTGKLTSKQIETLKKIYTGSVNPTTKEQIYTPYPLGSEKGGLGIDIQQKKEGVYSLLYQFHWLWGENFDYRQFDFDKDMDKMDDMLSDHLNANNPDLSAFKKRGGKLLMYTGTNDAIVPFQDALNYYERVIQNTGELEETQRFFRYFIIPGMAHCGGGPGLNECGQKAALNVPLDDDHDMITALISWVEKGKVPEKFIVTSYNEWNPEKGIRMQRPVFPYPEFPEYTEGDPNLPSSYKPGVHERGKVAVPAERYLK
ncbi:tannase/feruloyl esterase family alpha/beta hydrolase [Dysgonomonas sp. 520]|uniref:tannase/feruloyl esterase family alpha/beta hydrolase n=1 Tax=Dysgonomonas sp. 520 TaxID=2302931 RepID=UPI0013D48259|nr:tannase/feruloyl esterase family alpha/beta hydrolase [Dysgonomonas sp. 520]NDW10863.1 tannase/feruloyl esterase family alpha/beta hydrolase [Dysgonomonas sp. 520]